MRATSAFLFSLLLVVPLTHGAALAKDRPASDLVATMPALPEIGTAACEKDLEEVTQAARTRTPESESRALADADMSFRRFADVVGPPLAHDALPKNLAFVRQCQSPSKEKLQSAKRSWRRPRPFVRSRSFTPPRDSSTASQSRQRNGNGYGACCGRGARQRRGRRSTPLFPGFWLQSKFTISAIQKGGVAARPETIFVRF